MHDPLDDDFPSAYALARGEGSPAMRAAAIAAMRELARIIAIVTPPPR
jgi:hypothetical protein